MSAPFHGFYRGRTVLVTGHTGFKGSWLSLWLHELGARVVGFSLDPPTDPSHFATCGIAGLVADERGDVRDVEALSAVMRRHRPDLVLHLAAQPIVRRAYTHPRETFEVNVMGTVNVLEAARVGDAVQAVLVATSDKSYRNVGWDWAYRETDPLGGHEPYAASKACAELVAEVYRGEHFQRHATPPSRFAVATARAGNVIGGGDWAADRLVPDVVRALHEGRDVVIRNPHATRPWQHVLDCLAGYLALAATLARDPETGRDAWNFGPSEDRSWPVEAVGRRILDLWPAHRTDLVVTPDPPGKEAAVLRVDSSKAIRRLGWRPCWSTEAALDATMAWYRRDGEAGADLRALSVAQIADYTAAARAARAAWAAP